MMDQEKTTQDEIDALAEDLTKKELAFAEFYLNEANFNGTRAAELAGYQGSANTLGSTAYKLLRKPAVVAYIKARLDDVMPSGEVLHRLAGIARASINDVLADGDHLWFDKNKAQANGSIHKLKKIKVKRFVKETKTDVVEQPSGSSDPEDGEIIENHITRDILSEEIEFEMLDQMAALDKIGKYHKLFSDRLDLSGDLSMADVSIYIPDNGRD